MAGVDREAVVDKEHSKVWTILGLAQSSRPPVQVGDNLYDANTWDEIQRRVKASSNGEDGVMSDRDFMLALGMTAERLIEHTGLTDDEIKHHFGFSRNELVESLDLPTEEEVLDFSGQHAVQD